MAKVFSPLAKTKEIVSAYGFMVEPNVWSVYSDSETLSRMLALYHESEIEAIPAFSASMDACSYIFCNISMLEIKCSLEDFEQANYWLLKRSHYKVDVTVFAGFPSDVPHLLEEFLE